MSRGTTELLHRPKGWGPPVFQPAMSPDGRAILYLDYDSQPPTNRLVRVTIGTRDEGTVASADSGRFFSALALSGDGTQAAVITQDARGGAVLSVVPVDGEAAREVVRGGALGVETQVAWSPDQKSLFFTGRDVDRTQARLFRVDVRGGVPQPVGLAANRLRSVSLRADGRAIAFESTETRNSEVWALENFLSRPKTVP